MIFRKEQPIPEEAVSLREQRAMQGDRLSFAACEHSFFPGLTAAAHRDFYAAHFPRFND